MLRVAIQVTVDLSSSLLAITHGEDHRGTAADDVTTGKDAGDTGGAVVVNRDIPPFIELQASNPGSGKCPSSTDSCRTAPY